MDITIVSQTIPNWRHGDGSFVLRVEVEDSFFAANGEHISSASNGNCFEVSANASGGVCVTDALIIPSTTDALDNQLVRYKSAAIYKRSVKKHTILEDFVLPDELAPETDFPTIAIRNNNFIAYQDLSGYSKSQVDALIQQYVNVSMPDSSTLTKGRLKLSAAPTNPTNPIAVGTNDPLVTAQVQTRYAESYVSLTDAVAAIGSVNKTKLVVSTSLTPSADISIPRNITVDFEAGGSISPSLGTNVTIQSMRDPGSRQVFFGAGKVIVAQNAVKKIDLTWWTGRDDSIDATKAIKDFTDSLWSGAAEARIPMGMWKTSQTINFPLNSVIEGMSNRYSGFKLTTNNIPLMRIQSIVNVVVSDIHIKNLLLDVSGVTGGTGLLLSGTAPWSISGITLADVRFRGGIGLDFNATDNSWELQHLTLDRCIFDSNAIGFRSNSINSDVHFEQPFFYLPPGGIGMYIGAIGTLTVNNHNCFGSSPLVPGIPIADNSTLIYLFGARNVITIEGGQDENIEYFMRTSTNPYPQGIFLLKANLVQSKIKANTDTSLVSENNLYVFTHFGIFQNDASAAFVVYSKNDSLDGRNMLDQTPNPTYTVDNFSGSRSRLARVENLTEDTTKIGQFTQFRPGAGLAGITQTISPAFANTQKPFTAIYGEGIGAPFLELSDKSGGSTFGYQFYRDTDSVKQLGWLVISGNQSGFKGVYFDLPAKILGDTIATLTAAQTLTNKILSGAANTFSNIPQSAITNLTADLGTLTTNINLKSPIASPTFTGTPSAPTAGSGTNTTQIATTAFVQAQYAANHLTGSASLDFPSIAAVSQADLTITVTGAVLGDTVTATPNGAPEAGLVWNAFVSAANTVTIRMSNITAGAINPAARNWKVTVIK